MAPPVYTADKACIVLPGYAFVWLVLVLGLAIFLYTLYRRYLLISCGQPDPRFSSIGKRFFGLILYGILQKRQLRYIWVGVLHITIFWGFVVLGLHSIDLLIQGLSPDSGLPFMQGSFGSFYNSLKDLFELIVLIACILAILRRAVARPKRYEGSHNLEAYLILFLISFLMITDMFFEGSGLLLDHTRNTWLPAAQLAMFLLPKSDPIFVKSINLVSYWLHILTFFFFLNFLPISKHFHIITALPNLFFRRLSKGSIKPARWGVEELEELDILGIEKFEDFTWKHILDFFTCTECGRCSDNCPANEIGRPLSPKMMTIKLRDYGYQKVPIFKWRKEEGVERDAPSIIGDLITDDEIWSCTTCGACEEECPVFIEYIDKIIDMRRHLIETSQNPRVFNQVLIHFEKTGNPFGKPAAKRAEWVEGLNDIHVKILKEGDNVDVLYFVDSYASYDPRIQAIASSIVRGFHIAGIEFGILGSRERDSGHQVRRMGEEGLFQFLMEENLEALKNVRFRQMVTTDPHAFNTLKNDYPIPVQVTHYTQFFLSLIESGRLKPSNSLNSKDVYTYHDPCYLGRHNNVYDEPRKILHSLPGINLVEMKRSRDRSFCCGGGDIALWYEIEQEEMRMAEKRIQMARDAGANIIVTACPFCLIHFEDAIKTSGLEKEMKVIDLMELLISTL